MELIMEHVDLFCGISIKIILENIQAIVVYSRG